MAFWNAADLIQPPVNFCKVKMSLNDYTKLRKIFQTAKETFQDLHILNNEAALLSRIIYRCKTKFRTDKAFHKVEAVNRGLLKYLALDFVSIYAAFEKDLHRNEQLTGRIQLVQNEISVPSRQMLEWILIRTQGFARLFCYVVETCETAFSSWLLVITRGTLWDVSTMLVSILGRIWALARYFTACACDWYNELLPFRDILKPVSMEWLPKGYKLPQDLKLWLNVPHITDCKTNGQDASNSDMSVVLKLLKLNEGTDSILPLTSDSIPTFTTPNVDDNVDLGVSVSREELVQRLEMPKKIKKNTTGKNVPETVSATTKNVSKTKKLNKRPEVTNSMVNNAVGKKMTLKELLAEEPMKTTDNLQKKKKKMKDLPAASDSVETTNNGKKKKKVKELMATSSIADKLERKKKLKKINKEVLLGTTDDSGTRSKELTEKKKKNKSRLVAIKEEKQKKTKTICQ